MERLKVCLNSIEMAAVLCTAEIGDQRWHRSQIWPRPLPSPVLAPRYSPQCLVQRVHKAFSMAARRP